MATNNITFTPGAEVRVKKQLRTEKFVIKDVLNGGGYLLLDEFKLTAKGEQTKQKPKRITIPIEDVVGIQKTMKI